MPGPVDELERLTFDPATGAGAAGSPSQDDLDAQAAAAAAAQQEAQALAAMEQGVQRLVFFGLKALRAYIARRLPEIHQEWPDQVLHPPADAAVPLLRKHMGRLIEVAGANPELAVLAVSLVPLGMGYMAAVEKHTRTVEDVAARPAAGEGVAANG